MLFLTESIQVRSVADLGFDLLLAITEVVVGNDRDNHSAFIAAGQLESQAVIIEFSLVVPAHAVAAVTLRGGIQVRQTELFLSDLCQVRRENNATSVPGPVISIQPGIVLRQKRVAGVSKDALNEIEIADETARHDKPDLHRFFRGESRHFRTDDWPQEQRNKTLGLLFLCGGEWQAQLLWRRSECELEQPPCDPFWY